jgi:hypothetical protein
MSSIFSILMTNNIVSMIIVPMPITKLSISEPVYESPNILSPKKYPHTNDKNMSVMNPKPNARVNLYSYLAMSS